MTKYFNKIIVFALVLALFTVNSFTSFANTSSKNGKTVFVDGVEYNVSIDEEFNTTVKTVGLKNQAELVIDKYGNGSITGVKGQNKGEVYNVTINELSSESLDVKIKSNGKEIQKFTKPQDLLKDEYIGQTLVIGGVVIAGALLQALIAAGLFLVIAGVSWVAVTAVADIIQNSSAYFQCMLTFAILFINPIDITRLHAVNRIKGGYDVYTWSQLNASSIVISAGKGIVGPENHYDWWKVGDYYDHYHTADRNGAHSFYGSPQYRSLTAPN